MEPIELIPLDRLGRSEFNVRRTGIDDGIAELAASIERDGLLQNLTVVEARPGPSGRTHEVVAGGRRLAALQLLAKQGKIPRNHHVPCRVIDAGGAEAISLAENQLRQAMHPADQFEAFKERVDAGQPIEDVAARFGVTPKFVEQRLRLSAVAPQLIEVYRSGGMTLEILQAFTICNDHARQVSIWDQFGRQDGGPYLARIIRGALQREAIKASDPIARFVGLKNYEKAGGAVTSDLFADDDDGDGITLADSSLVEKLAMAKLEKQAAKLKKDEGLAWCLAVLEWSYDEINRYGKVPTVRREMTEDEAKRYAALEEQIEAKSKQLEALHDNDDDDYTLADEITALEEQRDAMDEALVQPDPNVMPYAGAVVSIGQGGKVEIRRNLIRPEDKKHLKPSRAEKEQQQSGGDDDGPKAKHSDKLLRELQNQRTSILAYRMAISRIALPTVVMHMLCEDLSMDVYGRGQVLTMRSTEPVQGEGRAAERLLALENERLDPIRALLAQHDMDTAAPALFDHLLAMTTDDLLDLLAICVANRVDLSGTGRGEAVSDLVADRLLTDSVIADFWEPTRENYLDHVAKSVVLDAVAEYAGPGATRSLVTMKRAEAAQEAEEILRNTGWLPAPMRQRETDHA